MLKANGRLFSLLPLRHIGGDPAGIRTCWGRAERVNAYVGEGGIYDLSGVPSGHLAPSSWLLPLKAGGMSAFTFVGATFTAAGAITEGRNIDAADTATFTAAADLTLAVFIDGSATATFTPSATLGGSIDAVGSTTVTFSDSAALTGGIAADGSATFTFDADGATLGAGSPIDGSTTITFDAGPASADLIAVAVGSTTFTFDAAGNAVPTLPASGSTTATFTVPTAALTGPSVSVASTTMTFETSSTLWALGNLSGDITPYTELSPQNLAAAVMSSVVDGTYTVEDVLKILAAVAAGKTTVNDLGGGSAEVIFRNLTDALDRVQADMTGSERAAVTLDLA